MSSLERLPSDETDDGNVRLTAQEPETSKACNTPGKILIVIVENYRKAFNVNDNLILTNVIDKIKFSFNFSSPYNRLLISERRHRWHYGLDGEGGLLRRREDEHFQLY